MKNRRTAKYYVVDGKVLSSGDLRRLHRYMIEVESISVISRCAPWLKPNGPPGAQAAAEGFGKLMPVTADATGSY